jgi:hypothetical protein
MGQSRRAHYPEWLRTRWEETRRATADRVSASVKKLVKEKKAVTLAAICKTIELDYGLSMSPNTIKRNHLAYDIYKNHRKVPVTRPLRNSDLDQLYKDIAPESKQKMQSKVSRLRRQPKDALITKLIRLEQRVERQDGVENALRDELIEMNIKALAKGAS